MNIIEDIIRRVAGRLGWEIGNRIENVVWSVVIGIILLCCCCFSVVAVFFQVVMRSFGN
jgi:tetrahydromethanopterin S-methyltransferase subunit G